MYEAPPAGRKQSLLFFPFSIVKLLYKHGTFDENSFFLAYLVTTLTTIHEQMGERSICNAKLQEILYEISKAYVSITSTSKMCACFIFSIYMSV